MSVWRLVIEQLLFFPAPQQLRKLIFSSSLLLFIFSCGVVLFCRSVLCDGEGECGRYLGVFSLSLSLTWCWLMIAPRATIASFFSRVSFFFNEEMIKNKQEDPQTIHTHTQRNFIFTKSLMHIRNKFAEILSYSFTLIVHCNTKKW